MDQLEAPEEGRARSARVQQLADALERGTELSLFETALPLEKEDREGLIALLDALAAELGARAGRSAHRRRLLRAEDLIRRLRGAAQLNGNAGQLAGWLCAGMFLEQ